MLHLAKHYRAKNAILRLLQDRNKQTTPEIDSTTIVYVWKK